MIEQNEDSRSSGEVGESSPPKDPEEMGFLEHLEELRWRILYAVAAMIIGSILCFSFSDVLMDLLIRPYEEAVLSIENQQKTDAIAAVESFVLGMFSTTEQSVQSNTVVGEIPSHRRLQALRPMTYFFISIQVALLGGLLIALPIVFLQIWKFVAPGLLKNEQRIILPIVSSSVLCFALGGAIAYFIVLPMGLRFFLALEPPDMTSQWAADEYVGFVLRLLFGFGIVFEMPVITLLLAKAGLLTAKLMRKYRRYAIIGIFVLAAFITPPDPVSQLMMAMPLLILYEVSIWVCKLFGKKRK